ncbi:sulfotransferase family 2 domain-containing protein [Gymnodinialimonas ceratoperidinii]|uniref:Sulfotransferase family protein n=1 Tax=Gymnodinialimonas ceratoperidinii TaxID=2856823 RepID=A0A8F6TWY4_9RHOB|nr:sulfotransferase family 2 domain-containing protein [Gymnodinialimonas ceratoperidinii]QXT39453.1 sulfotransferase family protein [Gymnodinialimonas ceratoperidinii]
MPIFRIGQKNILFLHIPKAGGTSIETWLSTYSSESFRLPRKNSLLPCVPQHFHGEILSLLFAPDFFDYSFCVTRNPYDRLLSEYNYRMSHRKRLERIFPTPDFQTWVRRTFKRYRKDPFIYSNHIRPQSEFMIAGTEHFHLENGLGTLQQRLADLTGVALPDAIPTANRSTKRETSVDPAVVGEISDFYAEDFETFGYER